MPKDTPEKYLTDMKEIPSDNSTPNVVSPIVPKRQAKVDIPKADSQPTKEIAKGEEKKVVSPVVSTKEEPKVVSDKPISQVFEDSVPLEIEKKKFPLSPREIILVVINVISVIFLIVLLTKLPAKAEELKKLRITNAKDDTAIAFEFDKIQSRKEDYEKLKELFVDESGIVRFVNEVEKFKDPDSSVQKVTFTTQKAVKDRSGNFGIPVVIEMTGTWEQIGKDMERIQVLPFLFRPATFESKPTFERPETTDVRYGVLLYVKEDLAKK